MGAVGSGEKRPGVRCSGHRSERRAWGAMGKGERTGGGRNGQGKGVMAGKSKEKWGDGAAGQNNRVPEKVICGVLITFGGGVFSTVNRSFCVICTHAAAPCQM